MMITLAYTPVSTPHHKKLWHVFTDTAVTDRATLVVLLMHVVFNYCIE